MKIFILHHYYPAFLKDFYARHPQANNLPYQDQRKLLMDEQFGTADFYSKNLELLGHTAEEFIINNEYLQKRWAYEHNISYSRGYFKNVPKLRSVFKSNWMEKIAEEQIKNFKPDVVYSHALGVLSTDFLRKIKKQGILLTGQIAAPLPDEKYLKEYDVIFSSFPHYVEKFKAMGIASEYFNLGFEDTILPTLKKTEKQYNTVFIGSIGEKHTASTQLFEYAAQKTPIGFWGQGIKNLPLDSSIRKHYHGQAWGCEMYAILHNAKIAINRHIDVAENHANNMRLYEATGVGAMLLTDAKDNLHELFEVGKEIETYASQEELVEKIQYYLSHEEECKKIAEAGQKRTLRDHTYKKRMGELALLLNIYIS